MSRNILLSTDSYKTSHFKQYPPGTLGTFNYVEARSNPGEDFTIFFGLQAILKEYLAKPFTREDIEEAAELYAAHGVPFNREGFEWILNVHDGYFPVEIRAVAEGSKVPNGNVLMTIVSTDSKVPWVPGFLETLLLRVWYPTTVATRSYQAKQIIADALRRTADDLSGLPFKLHDFGARGVSSGESAALGGLAHLVNFQGTDTVEALVAARRYYDEKMAGFSIPAAEHSTITSWGKENEARAYENMLTQFGKPGAILAVVSDSYDIDNAVTNLWGGELRTQVINSGATVVIRPDSGDPVTMVEKVVRRLDAAFGHTVNSKGFKVLKNVRVIQGDGLDNPSVIRAILGFLEIAGYSADNVAFGMGGGLLQKVNRDTFAFAMKCSAINIGGQWNDVYKEAPGKASKRGLLDLIKRGDKYETVKINRPWSDDAYCALDTVYQNGHLYARTTLSKVREVANKEFV